MKENDKLISLASRSINYCLGCNACRNDLKEYFIIEDDMQEMIDLIHFLGMMIYYKEKQYI